MCTGTLRIQITRNPTIRKRKCQEIAIGIYIAHEYGNLTIETALLPREAQDIRSHCLRFKAGIGCLHKF